MNLKISAFLHITQNQIYVHILGICFTTIQLLVPKYVLVSEGHHKNYINWEI